MPRKSIKTNKRKAKEEVSGHQPELKKPKPDEHEWLTFVVNGGEEYQVTRGQIQRHAPSSLIARMIDPNQQMQTMNSNGHFKLGYESEYYPQIFKYLETGQCYQYDLDLSYEQNEQLRIDFDYFQLELSYLWTIPHRVRGNKQKLDADVLKVAPIFADVLFENILITIDESLEMRNTLPAYLIFDLFKDEEKFVSLYLHSDQDSKVVGGRFIRLDTFSKEQACIIKRVLNEKKSFDTLMKSVCDQILEIHKPLIQSISASSHYSKLTHSFSLSASGICLQAKIEVTLSPLLH